MTESESNLRTKFVSWMETPLEPLVDEAISSGTGVAHSGYEMNGRTAALIVAVHPKTEPWKGRAEHYFDENQGNHIVSIRGASYSLVMNNAFELAPQGICSVFVIYSPPVVIFSAVVEDQIKALEREFL